MLCRWAALRMMKANPTVDVLDCVSMRCLLYCTRRTPIYSRLQALSQGISNASVTIDGILTAAKISPSMSLSLPHHVDTEAELGRFREAGKKGLGELLQ